LSYLTKHALKLTTHVRISRTDDIDFSIKGKDVEGNNFSTVFGCFDKEEGDLLIEELKSLVDSGEMVILTEAELKEITDATPTVEEKKRRNDKRSKRNIRQ